MNLPKERSNQHTSESSRLGVASELAENEVLGDKHLCNLS
jgi:hypothetical protein